MNSRHKLIPIANTLLFESAALPQLACQARRSTLIGALGALAALTLALPAQAATNTWNGSTGNWSTAGSWSTGSVPTAADDVVVNAGTVTLTTGASAASLSCSGGAIATNGFTLSVSGSTSASCAAVRNGAGALSKSGVGTQTMTATTTYTGTTAAEVPFAPVANLAQTRVITVPSPTVTYSVAKDDMDQAKFDAAFARALDAHPEWVRAALEKSEVLRLQAASAAMAATERAVYSRYSLDTLHVGAPVLGNAKAPVTLVEMFDYNCSFCRQVQPRIAALLKSSPDLRVVMVMTPILGADSNVLARFALAADLQGRFAQVHDSLFTGPTPQPTDEAALSFLAKTNGVNWQRAKADMASAAVTTRLAAMQQDWEALGRAGTPMFLTPKGRIVGAVSIEVLAASLNAGERGK